MIKNIGLAALAVASASASAFANGNAFSQVVAELNATASAGQQGSAASVSLVRDGSSQQALATGGALKGNAGALVDLTNVLGGTGLTPNASVKPGSWAFRGDAPPSTDGSNGVNPSGPDPVSVIPLPSALGLAGVGLLALTIRRRSSM